jgi:hypothetical protein
MIQEFDGTTEQFARIVREMFPNCRICEDDEGQLVIYTGAAMQMGGEVVSWLPDDEDVYQSWCDRNPEVM